jgi:nucleotide-binding universal stress UspA family protein
MSQQSIPTSTRETIPEMLVPFDGSHAAEMLLRRACRTARADGSAVLVLCVVNIPADLDLDELPESLDDTVMVALTHAQDVCREEGVAATFELTYARDLADAILEEAERSGAALICLSMDEHAPNETALMSPTVQSVLASAHCSVFLSNPGADLQPPASGG